jgi:hypothetical protein
MSPKKNAKAANKDEHPTRSIPSKGSVRGNSMIPEIVHEAMKASEPLPEEPGVGPVSDPSADQASTSDEFDMEMALTFLTDYHALEQALVRAGYTRASRSPGSTQADWELFARHIEDRFDPDSSAVLQGAVAHLLWHEENMDLRRKRLQDCALWEDFNPNNDIVWISELLQHTRNKLIHGINLPGLPGCDFDQVLAALFVVEAWSHVDSKVESMLMPGL